MENVQRFHSKVSNDLAYQDHTDHQDRNDHQDHQEQPDYQDLRDHTKEGNDWNKELVAFDDNEIPLHNATELDSLI